jgi:hypothetical protein
MRLLLRVSLLSLLSLALVVPVALADHFQADCPLSLVGTTAPTSEFYMSPHGTFRNGSVVYLLRGETLTTLNMTDIGDLSVARQDRIASLAGIDDHGDAAYNSGYLYVVSEAGLEIFDLRNTRGGSTGTAPVFVSRSTVPHYRRVAVSGNLLAAIYPMIEMPCAPGVSPGCFNSIDIYSIADPTAPVLMSRISTQSNFFVGFNDIAWANGYLYATGHGGTFGFDLSNPSLPTTVQTNVTHGDFLFTNGTNLLGVGQETLIGIFTVGAGPTLRYQRVYTLPSMMNHSNPLMFHPEATFDDTNTRVITMIDEKDPNTLKPARTVAFDVFDMTVPQYEGYDDRIYENVSVISPDEVKWNPLAVGPYVYVNGEVSGAQTYGACGVMAGKLEFDTAGALPCGGSELRGYVTGANKIKSVEVFLDNSSLGTARLGRERGDISSKFPAVGFAINVNLDQVAKGEHLLRVVATDMENNTRQVYSRTVYFAGPGGNCTSRRRIRGN